MLDEAAVVRVRILLGGAFALADDRVEGRECGFRADDRIATLEVDLGARDLQVAIAAEGFLLADARHELVEVCGQILVERADGLVVDGHWSERAAGRRRA